jgi:hypothetical protein
MAKHKFHALMLIFKVTIFGFVSGCGLKILFNLNYYG